jgi:hypothetical protein
MAIPLGVAVLLFATGFYVLRSIVSSSIASRRNAAKARALKCEEPPFEKNRWPLGIDNLRRTLQADKNDRIPQDVVERFEALGTYTYVYEILGEPSQVVLTAAQRISPRSQGIGICIPRIPGTSRPFSRPSSPTSVSTALSSFSSAPDTDM